MKAGSSSISEDTSDSREQPNRLLYNRGPPTHGACRAGPMHCALDTILFRALRLWCIAPARATEVHKNIYPGVVLRNTVG